MFRVEDLRSLRPLHQLWHHGVQSIGFHLLLSIGPENVSGLRLLGLESLGFGAKGRVYAGIWYHNSSTLNPKP